MKGAAIGVGKEEMDNFNYLLMQFHADAKLNCPNIRFIGMLVEMPTDDGRPGCYSIAGPGVEQPRLAEILEEQGKWMKKFNVQ
jgi:hypothetical protein